MAAANRQTLAASAAVALPSALRDLLERGGLGATCVEDVTSLPGSVGPRRTLRIGLADGRVVKGRVLRDAEVATRMSRWIPRLRVGMVAPLLATSGAASLEAWCEGRPGEDLEEAGALLGEFHATIGSEDVSDEHPGLARWLTDAVRWVEELRCAGRLTGAHSERILKRLQETRPGVATCGLQHGDFCAENLVHGAGGLTCVDNTTLGPGILESDLAQTFYRWPMRPDERERFLLAYRRFASPDRFLKDETFWGTAGALRAAAYRLREGTGSVEVPLRELCRHAP